jgi:hypothetical protein
MVIKGVIVSIFNKLGWGVVKKCFQGLRQTALLSAEGKKTISPCRCGWTDGRNILPYATLSLLFPGESVSLNFQGQYTAIWG